MERAQLQVRKVLVEEVKEEPLLSGTMLTLLMLLRVQLQLQYNKGLHQNGTHQKETMLLQEEEIDGI
jgi:hypothetical protein